MIFFSRNRQELATGNGLMGVFVVSPRLVWIAATGPIFFCMLHDFLIFCREIQAMTKNCFCWNGFFQRYEKKLFFLPIFGLFCRTICSSLLFKIKYDFFFSRNRQELTAWKGITGVFVVSLWRVWITATGSIFFCLLHDFLQGDSSDDKTCDENLEPWFLDPKYC